MTVITNIQALPGSPIVAPGVIPVVITSSIPSYFRITGQELQRIVDFNWYPKNPGSVSFRIREIILVDNTLGTFMIEVTNNQLDTTDRAGFVGFRLDDGNVISFPVTTYGPVSAGPLWTAPTQGLITG